MKKILLIIVTVAFCLGLEAQKITQLPVATTAVSGSLIMVRSGTTGNTISQMTKANFLSDVDDYVADTVTISSIAPLLTDTIPIVVFGLGSGHTAVFNDNALAGSFYNKGSDTLAITSLYCVVAAGTGTETVGVNVVWSDTLQAVIPTKLNTSAYTVTSMTVGNEDTSFNNAKIPPNKWVWCYISGVSAGNRPSYLSVTLSGYKIPTY
jgi:hypothetical protein